MLVRIPYLQMPLEKKLMVIDQYKKISFLQGKDHIDADVLSIYLMKTLVFLRLRLDEEKRITISSITERSRNEIDF